MRLLMMLLWLSAVLLVTASTAMAEQITYNIVDYPLAEIDGAGYQDKVSGTITASTTGPLGSYTAGSYTPTGDPSVVNLACTITIQSSNPTLPILQHEVSI
jgi:hypothetical protein